MTALYSAILNPAGPNFELWNEILGTHQVPLESAKSVLATLGDEQNVEVYRLNLKALTLRRRAKLIAVLAQKFGAPVYEVEAQIAKDGVPIRAADVIVSYDSRVFV